MKDKGLVKRRSYERSFVPVIPDTPPPTPIRNDYLPPPPVEPSDENFVKPEIDTAKALGNDFSRPTTKIIDAKKKKKKYKSLQKRKKQTLTKKIYQNSSLNFFLSLMKL